MAPHFRVRGVKPHSAAVLEIFSCRWAGLPKQRSGPSADLYGGRVSDFRRQKIKAPFLTEALERSEEGQGETSGERSVILGRGPMLKRRWTPDANGFRTTFAKRRSFRCRSHCNINIR
jgi:hypothetical protein